MITCNQKCLNEPACDGFNYQLRSDDGMLGLCELKDSGIEIVGGDQSLRYKLGFVFVQLFARGYVSILTICNRLFANSVEYDTSYFGSRR